jgi:hypothetical protein
MFQAKFNLGKLIIYLFNSGLNQGRIRLFLVISCVFKAPQQEYLARFSDVFKHSVD